MAIAALGLEAGAVALAFSGGDRGWKGDVPIVRLNSQRLRASGWENRYTAKQAIRQSLEEMLADVRGGRL
jgi:UDP-glucose 4-epimerase